ncbi:Rieske (2Fe-2S) protein [Streptomyces sp. NPDC053720]|uniref:Rieske (2Fe-2S) protein n=1 Tax=Streptomyces sp. NPDC053720 TaxID=3154855 RepID=UPI003434463D
MLRKPAEEVEDCMPSTVSLTDCRLGGAGHTSRSDQERAVGHLAGTPGAPDADGRAHRSVGPGLCSGRDHGREDTSAARRLVGIGLIAVLPAAAAGASDWYPRCCPMSRPRACLLQQPHRVPAGRDRLDGRRGVIRPGRRRTLPSRGGRSARGARSAGRGPVCLLSVTCTHAGGPLDEGHVVADGCISCPWHASAFRLTDGKVDARAGSRRRAPEGRQRTRYVRCLRERPGRSTRRA